MNSSIFNFKHYFVTILIISLSLLSVCLGSAEIYLRSQSKQIQNKNDYRQRLINGHAPWVAVGDSHVANGLLSTDWLDNLGQPSDNLESIISKLEIRMKQPGLKGIILPADAQIFAFYRLTADQRTRIQELLDDSSSPLLILQTANKQYLTSLVWSIATNPASLWLTDQEVVRTDVLPDPKSEKWRKDAQLRVQLHTPVREFKTTRAAERYWRMVREIKMKGIKVCMVAYPLSGAYRQAIGMNHNFAVVKDFYAEIAAIEKVRYVDASALFPDALFGDPDHLSDRGAIELTSRLFLECDVADTKL